MSASQYERPILQQDQTNDPLSNNNTTYARGRYSELSSVARKNPTKWKKMAREVGLCPYKHPGHLTTSILKNNTQRVKVLAIGCRMLLETNTNPADESFIETQAKRLDHLAANLAKGGQVTSGSVEEVFLAQIQEDLPWFQEILSAIGWARTYG